MNQRYPTPGKDIGPGTSNGPGTRDTLRPPYPTSPSKQTDARENITFPQLLLRVVIS